MFLAFVFASSKLKVRRLSSSFVIVSRSVCACERSDVRRSAVCAISSWWLHADVVSAFVWLVVWLVVERYCVCNLVLNDGVDVNCARGCLRFCLHLCLCVLVLVHACQCGCACACECASLPTWPEELSSRSPVPQTGAYFRIAHCVKNCVCRA